MRKRWTGITALVASMATLLLVSCGGDEVEEPAVALSEVDRDRSDLCFDAKTLPDGFELTTRNPGYFTGTLTDREYSDLGRTASRAHRYVFEPPSTPGEDADGFLSPEERAAAYARAEREAMAVPFTASTCRVDIYATVEGARRAIESEREALTNAPPLQGGVATELTSIQESYTTVIYEPSPSETEVAVTFRASNVIGRVTLTGTCADADGQGCSHVPVLAESLARLLFTRVSQRLKLTADSPSAPGDPVLASAEDDCPEQDYLGCIGEYSERTDAPEIVSLCRTQYDGWFFEPPTGEVDDRCSDDESRIVAILGGR